MPDDDFLPADNDAWIDDQGRTHIVVRPLNSGLPVANGYDPVNDLASYVKSLPVDQPPQNPLPTHETYVQTPGEKAASILTGGNGQERFQFFPERMVRSALSLPADVMSGKLGPYADPYRNGPISSDVEPEDELLQRVQDMAGLMGTGPLAMKPGTATLGSGMVRSIKEYAGQHGAPDAESGSPLHNVTANGTYPEDFYSHNGLRYYGTGDDTLDAITYRKIIDAKNNPDKMVNVYRAIPWDGKKPNITLNGNNDRSPINPGDWVTINKQYAKDHGEGALNGNYAITMKKVPAKELFTNGDSLHEWGWHPNTLMSDTSKPGMALSALENAPTYYSAVENAINTATTKSASPNQWLSTIQNSKGVKPEELEWNGLKGWLGSQEGSVSKEQIQSYLNENKTQINEVNKGQGTNFDQINKLEIERKQVVGDLDRARSIHRTLNGVDREANALKMQQLADREEVINKEILSNEAVPTKHSQWQLPGGENYREKLLTLPREEQPYVLLPKNNGDITGLQTKFKNREEAANYYQSLTKDQKYSSEIAPIRAQAQFKSSHWDEPNILAHIRMNDRFMPDENGPKDVDSNFNERKGYKALHIEEIQSDWHQQGREQGYKLSKEAEAKLEPEFNRIDDKIINSNDEEIMGHPDINQSIKMAVDRKIITPDEAKSYLRYSDSQRLKAVPDAPFKKTWLDLAVKNVLREAAEKGYDRLSWTPGEAQAARYDLSKQVDKINLSPNQSTSQTTPFKFKIEAYKNNHKVVEHYAQSEDEIADVIGKEPAKKLLESRNENGFGNLSGENLKIGGEGMHYFYDKMLPNVLEKLTGQKANRGYVKGSGPDLIEENVNGTRTYRKPKDEELDKHKINYIDLPQSVKDTALQKGFPLFSGGLMLNPVEQQPTVKLTPMNHDPFSKGDDSDPEVNNRDDVPYLAGASNTPSGYPVNIDRRMPRYDDKVKLPNGQPADLWKYLKIHEIAEYKQMQAGVSYEQAHIKGGTVAERQAVEADGVDWATYEHVMDGYLSEIEHEHPLHPPKQLYDKPYPHNKKLLLEKNEANEQ